MKRKLAVLLALLCLIAVLLPGCKGAEKDTPQKADSDGGPEKTEPLQVFMDIEYGSSIYLKLKNQLSVYMNEDGKKISFKNVIKDKGGPSDIKFEIPPIGDERENYLTRLRTEIMAGGGPDVYVSMCGTGFREDEKSGEYFGSEPLFRFPQQAMKRNMFLALDEYIEKAQFMEWDKLTPVVMESGRTDKGQFLLPMTYTVPATIFQSSDVDHTQSKEMTWEEMLDGGPQMRLAAVRDISLNMGAALAPMVDYEHDKLAVSEEELARYIIEKVDNMEKYKEESGVPHVRYEIKVFPDFKPSIIDERFDDDKPITMVPLYSRGGGSAATVTSFAAINANTKRPDDAFFIVDYLLSEECQRSMLYSYVTVGKAVPTMEGLMTHNTGVAYLEKNFVMSNNFYEQFCAVRDTINYVDFATPLNMELNDLYYELLENPDKPRETAIHDAYMRMNMMLAES